MFTLTVRDHMMIAHSLPDPYFGPAQALHGATYVIEVSLRSAGLNEHGVVMDIGAAGAHLAAIAGDLSYRNLDEHPALSGTVTTTEVLARYIAEQMAEAVAAAPAAPNLQAIEVRLRESPDAWAGYTLSPVVSGRD